MNQQGDRKPMTTKNLSIDYDASLHELWKRIGKNPPEYPITRQEVERLLASLGFTIPACGIEYLEQCDLLAIPGNDQWEAHDIGRALGGAIALQWFRREPSLPWWHYLTDPQRLRATNPQSKFEERFARFHPLHLSLLLLNAPDRRTREQVHAALEIVLESNGLTW